jgi:hypothetical protein
MTASLYPRSSWSFDLIERIVDFAYWFVYVVNLFETEIKHFKDFENLIGLSLVRLHFSKKLKTFTKTISKTLAMQKV